MKISVLVVFSFLLVGCESSRQSTSLTSEQAKAVAVRLANQKADALYRFQPFQDGQPARFREGVGFGVMNVVMVTGTFRPQLSLQPTVPPTT